MAMYQTQVHEQKALTTNQTATLQIPVGQKIQSLALGFATGAGAAATEAQIRAEIGNIRLTINGVDVVNCSADKLFDLYECLSVKVGTPAGLPGFLELNVGRLAFLDPAVRDVVGFGTADVATIQVQVTAGTLTNVASVTAYTQRQPVQENLGMYCKFVNYPQSYNSTGQHTVDTLPRDLNTSYLMVLIDDGASGTITAGECRVNAQTITENLPSYINAGFISDKGYNQPAGYYVHAFADATLAGQLPMRGVTDFRLLTTFTVAPGAGGYNITPLTLVIPASMSRA